MIKREVMALNNISKVEVSMEVSDFLEEALDFQGEGLDFQAEDSDSLEVALEESIWRT